MSLCSVIATVLLTLAAPDGNLSYVAVSPSGYTLTFLNPSDQTQDRIAACAPDAAPSWSPDGKAITFADSTDTGTRINVYTLASSSKIEISSQFNFCMAPRWNKEGTHLAYAVSDIQGEAAQIAVYDLAGQSEEVWGGTLRGVQNPVWMPGLELFRRLHPDDGFIWEGVDTKTLLEEAFSTGVIICSAYVPRAGKLSTELMIATRSQAAPLLTLLGSESARYAEWRVEPNKDGKMVAFESNDGGDREIFVLSRRGVIDSSNHRAADWNPVWSPDGEWIAFESFRTGPRGIYKMFPDTLRVDTVYATQNFQCWSPAWSPDGNDIAFLSDQSGNPEIYLMESGASEPEQLTRDGNEKMALRWQPRVKD